MEEVQATNSKPRVGKRLTQDRKDLIISLKKSGKTLYYIREHTGHSLNTITRTLKAAKAHKSKNKVAKQVEPAAMKAEIKTAPLNVIYEPPKHILPVKTNFLQRAAISLCRSLGVTDRMYGEN